MHVNRTPAARKAGPLLGLAALAALSLLGLSAARPAAAQVNGTYTSEATFAAAGGGLSLITFDSLTTPGNITSYSNLAQQGVTFTGSNFVIDPGYAPGAFGYTSPFLANNNASSLTITLPTGTEAVGFDTSGFYNGPAGLTLTAGGQSVSLNVPNARTVGFLGVTSATPFTTVTLTATGGDGLSLDNFRFTRPQVSAVPEPSQTASLGLGALGLLGLLVRARRRRSAAV